MKGKYKRERKVKNNGGEKKGRKNIKGEKGHRKNDNMDGK